MFSNIAWIFFSFFSYNTLRRIVRLFFSKNCSVIFFWWVIYSFSVIFTHKKLIFWYSLRLFFPIFLLFNVIDAAYWNDLLYFLLMVFMSSWDSLIGMWNRKEKFLRKIRDLFLREIFRFGLGGLARLVHYRLLDELCFRCFVYAGCVLINTFFQCKQCPNN